MSEYEKLQADADAIARRRKIAEALMAQGQAPLESMGTAGGAPIPISWTQGLAKMLQAYQGGKGLRETDAASKDLAARGESNRADAIQKVTDAINPVPGSPMPDAALGGGPAMPPVERTRDEKMRAVQDAVMSRDPSVQRFGEFQQRNIAAEDARAFAATEKRDAAEFSATEKRDAADTVAQDKLDQIREQHRLKLISDKQAQDAAAEAKRQHGDVLKVLAAGQQATTRAMSEGKVSKNEALTDSGRKTVSDLVTQLGGYYDELAKSGGITDPKKGVLSNVGAAVASSAAGQFAGRMVGTQNQSSRNAIAQQRPLLLNAIKQATGMSAKQMDSNAELKLYLSAATDPTLDVEANRAALGMLDKLYGLGENTPAPAGKPAPVAPGAGLSPAEQEELDQLRSRFPVKR